MTSEVPLRILLVDDNELDRSDAKAALLQGSSRRYHFTEAALASEAIALCKGGQIDCMVLDFHLPDGDALDVLAQLTCDADAMPRVPVVILTGIAGKANAIALRAGAQDYVGKDWLGPESLTWAVENAVERRKIAREVIAERQQMDAQRLELFRAERIARLESDRVTLMKDEFLATLSHELRTPLAAIVGWANVLQHAPDNPATVKRGIDAIVRNGHLQAKLIDELLDMNRIISGKLHLSMELLDIDLLVSNAVEMLRPLAESKGVLVSVEVQADAVTRVRGDTVRLQQIFANLLTNSLKFTPAGEYIRIAVRAAPNGAVEVEIADTGEGIDAKFLPYLFDRFSQGNSKADRVHGGLGMGLSIVKQLAELHGGTVTGRSAGLGLGAVFSVLLPTRAPEPVTRVAAPGTPAAAAADGPAPAGHDDLRGTSVLLVDDNADIRELTCRLLEEHGATVITANSGAAALVHLRYRLPHVLVSDISMPAMNGYDLIDEIRNTMGLSAQQLPAAAISAFAGLLDQQRALQGGFQAYIVKPIQPHLLVHTVASLARGGSGGRDAISI